MKLTWYGHSAFRVETEKAVILIDPFFSDNPAFDDSMRSGAVEGVTHIALTHGHFDHVGNTAEIAKETGATVLANFDLGQFLEQKRGLENLELGNTGGTVHQDGFSVTWVNAVHSSAYYDENGVSHDLGDPNGLVFHFDGAPTLYAMGDTDIFGDMALINELHQPEIGLVPIGDRLTMGGAVAALACKRFFNFKTIVPCHYGSFPIIDQSAETFVNAMDGSGAVKVPAVGETLEL